MLRLNTFSSMAEPGTIALLSWLEGQLAKLVQACELIVYLLVYLLLRLSLLCELSDDCARPER